MARALQRVGYGGCLFLQPGRSARDAGCKGCGRPGSVKGKILGIKAGIRPWRWCRILHARPWCRGPCGGWEAPDHVRCVAIPQVWPGDAWRGDTPESVPDELFVRRLLSPESPVPAQPLRPVAHAFHRYPQRVAPVRRLMVPAFRGLSAHYLPGPSGRGPRQRQTIH